MIDPKPTSMGESQSEIQEFLHYIQEMLSSGVDHNHILTSVYELLHSKFGVSEGPYLDHLEKDSEPNTSPKTPKQKTKDEFIKILVDGPQTVVEQKPILKSNQAKVISTKLR